MEKALVVGGSNGIGLAISKNLISRGYYVEICDRVEPEKGVLDSDLFDYNHCNLLDFDEKQFSDFAADENIKILMITAGVGRVADFESHHISEIEKMFTINTVSVIKIFKLFYNRILANDSFYAGVMDSISGWLSTPAASVYAASKAAVARFVESVNIELEIAGTSNRILDVSPASFKGSKFYGGKNDLDLISPLSAEIVEHLFSKETLFIPQYEETFQNVIARYHADPHEYGLHSYQYKISSHRLDNTKKVKIGYLSGTFDLFHVGHLNLLMRAKEQCDYLIVGVHGSGKWKGKETFIPLEERKRIVAACRYVDRVVDSCLEDSDAWNLYQYDRLFVGSDYKGTERFNRYEEFFKDKGVEIIYFPYTQGTSSTQIRNMMTLRTNNIKKEEE